MDTQVSLWCPAFKHPQRELPLPMCFLGDFILFHLWGQSSCPHSAGVWSGLPLTMPLSLAIEVSRRWFCSTQSLNYSNFFRKWLHEGNHLTGRLLRALQWTWLRKSKPLGQDHALQSGRGCTRNRPYGSHSSALSITPGKCQCGENDISPLVVRIRMKNANFDLGQVP